MQRSVYLVRVIKEILVKLVLREIEVLKVIQVIVVHNGILEQQ